MFSVRGPCGSYITSICYSLDETKRVVQCAECLQEKWMQSVSSEFSVEDSHRKFVVEKTKKSACEDLVCDQKI
jgi:hypothetical protein